MAKWTIGNNAAHRSLKGTINYDGVKGDSYWQIYQDEKPFLEQAKMDREASKKKTDKGYKKFATIPDIVAIEVKEKYGIDIHDTTFLHDKDKKAKFMTIIRQDYPHLLSY